MKHPVYWFLISSGLMASTSLSCAQGESQTLTPADSYNGNGTFTPKTSSNSTSTTYTCEGNVCIANAGNSSALTSSCFTQSTGDLLFIGHGYSLCFENINTTTGKPGAIELSTNDKTLSINGFSLFSCSSCPAGTTGTGAIKASGNSTFSNNLNLIFQRNCSTPSGGAIYTNKLIIKSSGPTIFSNNSVTNSDPKGGAICIADTSGECSLSADNGNIIFDGNKIITTGNSLTKRNAINIGTSGKFTQLRAKDGFGIFFYDPITGTGDTTTALDINKVEGTTTYLGNIIFSGEKLTPEEKNTNREPNFNIYTTYNNIIR